MKLMTDTNLRHFQSSGARGNKRAGLDFMTREQLVPPKTGFYAFYLRKNLVEISLLRGRSQSKSI